MKILSFNTKEEWLAWRRTGIGSSDIAAIMGIDPYRSPLDVYDSKDALYQETPPTARMQRGIDYEAKAREVFNAIYAETQEQEYVPLNVEHDEIPFFHASLDGYWNKRILEIKVPGEKVMEMAKIGEIPEYYRYQIQWQYLVTDDSEWANYQAYDPDKQEGCVMDVEPDYPLMERMKQAAIYFWKEHVEKGIPPPDRRVTKRIEDDEQKSNVHKMACIKTEIKALQEQYDRLQAQVLEQCGEDKSIEVDDVILSRSERQSIDYQKAARDAKVDLEAYKKPKTVVWTIKQKKETE
jgi:putative phage-type endonuclease